MEAPNVAFFVASLQSEVRGTKVTNFYEEVIQLCHKIGGLNSSNVIGQFEKQFQSDIADLDEIDELVFDEDELI